jgi:EmrB/QacA subfamily drug resistance transporter
LPEPVEPKPAAAPAAIVVSAAGRKWVFAAALATNFMAAIEGTIVATAMPTIVGSLGGFDLFSWVFTGYLLTQAVSVPIYGRLADLYGRKRLLFIGIGLFLAGSILCGFAWSMISLVVFRVIQGLGAGAVMPVAQTLLGDIYRGADRARMQGYISSVFGSAAILGPVIGAFIVARWSWSWVFWVNVPLGVVAAAMLAITLHERVERHQRRLDLGGAALFALGIFALMYALVEASALGRAALVSIVAVAVALIALFVLREFQTREPLLPVHLWRNPLIAYGNLAGLVSGAAMMGIIAFLPAYMQGAMGESVLAGGYALMALSGGWPAGGFTAGRVSLAFSYRAAVLAGGVVLVIGSVLMILLDPTRGAAWAIAATLLMGYGFGLANNTWGVAVQANVEWTDRGAATSSIVFTRIIGQSLGTAVYGGIINAALQRHMEGAGDLVDRLLEPALRKDIPPALIAPVMQDFAQALHTVYLINGLLAVVVLATAFGMPRGLTPQGSSSRS